MTDASADETRSLDGSRPRTRGPDRAREGNGRSGQLSPEERQAVREAARRVVAVERARADNPGPHWQMDQRGDGPPPNEIVEQVVGFRDDPGRWKMLMNRVRTRARELRGDDDRPRRRGASTVPKECRRESSTQQYVGDGDRGFRPV